MIARVLSRYADARLRARVDRLELNLAEGIVLMRRLRALLAQKTAEARTNYDLAQRWKAIAQGAQADLAAALNQEKQQ